MKASAVRPSQGAAPRGDPRHLTLPLLAEAGARKLPLWALLGRALDHLEAVCPECRVALAAFAAGAGPEAGALGRLLGGQAGAGGCSRAHRGVASSASAPGPRRRGDEALRQLVAELQTLAPEARERLLAQVPGLAVHSLWKLVIQAALVAADAALARAEPGPARAEGLADLALAVALRLDPRRYPPGLVADCRAESRAALARARVAAGKLAPAAEALRATEGDLEESSGDPYTAAAVLLARADLEAAEGRHPEALATFARAALLYRSVEDPAREGLARLRAAAHLAEGGRLAQSLAALARDLPPPARELADGIARAVSQAVEAAAGTEEGHSPGRNA